MNLHYQDLIPPEFHDDSRVWIYQSNRIFSINEVLQIEELLEQFSESWTSHGAKVIGYANVFFGQFIIIIADETATGVSGCSTDSSVRLIKEIEKDYLVNLFDRQSLAFIVKDRIQLLPLGQLTYAIENDLLNGDSLYFNNTIETKKELINNWIIAVKDSWLAKRFSFAS